MGKIKKITLALSIALFVVMVALAVSKNFQFSNALELDKSMEVYQIQDKNNRGVFDIDSKGHIITAMGGSDNNSVVYITDYKKNNIVNKFTVPGDYLSQSVRAITSDNIAVFASVENNNGEGDPWEGYIRIYDAAGSLQKQYPVMMADHALNKVLFDIDPAENFYVLDAVSGTIYLVKNGSASIFYTVDYSGDLSGIEVRKNILYVYSKDASQSHIYSCAITNCSGTWKSIVTPENVLTADDDGYFYSGKGSKIINAVNPDGNIVGSFDLASLASDSGSVMGIKYLNGKVYFVSGNDNATNFSALYPYLDTPTPTPTTAPAMASSSSPTGVSMEPLAVTLAGSPTIIPTGMKTFKPLEGGDCSSAQFCGNSGPHYTIADPGTALTWETDDQDCAGMTFCDYTYPSGPGLSDVAYCNANDGCDCWWDVVNYCSTLGEPPANDAISGAALISPTNTYSIDVTYATTDAEAIASNFYHSVWYEFSPSQDGLYSVALGNSGPTDQVMYLYKEEPSGTVSDYLNYTRIDSCTGLNCVLGLNATAGTNYFVEIGTLGESVTSSISLTIKDTVLYDDFESPGILTDGSNVTIPGLLTASMQTGEPDKVSGKYAVTHSVWFSYTATETKKIVFDTCNGSGLDLLAVFTGDELNSLTRIDDNRMGCFWNSSAKIEMNVVAGTTYMIQLSLQDSAYQNTPLNLQVYDDTESVTVPANDNFANAANINLDAINPTTGEYGFTRVYLYGSTVEAGEDTGSGNYRHSVWYKWTNDATLRQELWIDTCTINGQFGLDGEKDTLLDIYTGSSLNDLSLVAENDDWNNPVNPDWACAWQNQSSFLKFTAQPNTTYYFRVISLDNRNLSAYLNLRTKPVKVETETEVPEGSLWCSNHGPIARTIPYTIAITDWASCWSWCQANMSNTLASCQMNGDGPRNCWINYAPEGGMDNCTWAEGVYGPNTWPKGSYWGEITGYLMYLPNSLTGSLITNDNINVSVNRQQGERTVSIKDSENSSRITDVSANFVKNLNWTSVTGQADTVKGQSFEYNLNNAPEAGLTHTLYIPVPENKTSSKVIICPGVSSLSQISRNCSGVQELALGDSGTSLVTIKGQSYWKVENMTSSGGYAFMTSSLQVGLSETPAYVNHNYSFTVSALDSDTDVDTGYLGKVTITSTATGATLPAEYTYSGDDAGVHTFTVKFPAEGTYTITAQDANDTNLEAMSDNVMVLPAGLAPTETVTPAPTSTNTPVATPTVTLTATATLTPTAVPVAFEISDVKVTQINDGVQLCWSTSQEAKSSVRYGYKEDDLSLSTEVEQKASTDHCIALTIDSRNSDQTEFYYDIAAAGPDGQTTSKSGVFELLPVLLPVTGGSNSCEIDLPAVTGTAADGFQISFITDNNDENSCVVKIGSEVNVLTASGHPATFSSGKYNVYLNSGLLPHTSDVAYQIVCKNSTKECSYTNKIMLWNAASAGQDAGTNLLEYIVGENNKVAQKMAETANSAPAKVAVVGMISATAITFTLTNPQMFWVGLVWVYRRRKNKRFGLVYDERTNRAVPFAVVRLLETSTRKVAKETVTDLQGRYNLLADPGDYILEASHDAYASYHLPLILTEGDAQVTENIGLSKEANVVDNKQRFRETMDKLNKIFFTGGFIFSLFATLVNFQAVNVLILAVYAVQLVIMFLQKTPRDWGKVIEVGTGKAMHGVFISVLDPEEQRQLDISISDEQGRFGFILEKKEYLLKAAVQGFALKKVPDGYSSRTLPSGETAIVLPQGRITGLNLELEQIPAATVVQPERFGA